MTEAIFYAGVIAWGGLAGLTLFALMRLIVMSAFRLARLGSDKGRKS